MIITLTTGYKYDISIDADFRSLKKNINNMSSRKQFNRLHSIYEQVETYHNYNGNKTKYKRAAQLAEIISSKIPKPETAEPQDRTQSNEIKTTSSTARSMSSLLLEEIKRKREPLKIKPMEKAPVQVSFRDDQGKAMHAAFFDHYLIRKITHHPTSIILADGQTTQNFEHFVDKIAAQELALDEKEQGKKVLPPISTNDPDASGLLFIPGRHREDKDSNRRENEKLLIHKARNRGQPILAVCAGSWQLWEEFGGTTKNVSDHCYARMPSIGINGNVTYNVAIHSIQVKSNTILSGALNYKSAGTLRANPLVNSVHWAAPDGKNIPRELQVTATALRETSINLKNRQGNEMEPTIGSIEAFESKYAPFVGIQWHPEAYFHPDAAKVSQEDKRHQMILKDMAKAGDAYHAKRNMMTEFLKHVGTFRKKLATSQDSSKLDEKSHDPTSIHYNKK